jgi:ABC-type transport system involved in Fe-S cluster assembly fused permease/ATPase subunit
MVLSGAAIMRGAQTIGDFVMINAHAGSAFFPLNFIGTVYREIKQGLARRRGDVPICSTCRKIQDKPGAQALVVKEGTVRFENVSFALRSEHARS